MPADINPALAILRRQAKASEDALYEARHRLDRATDEAVQLKRALDAKQAEVASWETAIKQLQDEFDQLRQAIEAATGESYY